MTWKKEGWNTVETASVLETIGMKETNFILNGNEACALGAIMAGCRFFAGYPITPSSGILHAMAEYLPLFGGKLYTPEDEIASIGMCISTSLCGKKAMTATSGPGFSLMQEELGIAILNEVPLVIVNAMRIGPSTGQPTKPGSADINCMIHGRHGDAGDAVVILSPSSVLECFLMTVAAFNIAEEWRTPVFVALDGYLSQLEECVNIPAQIDVFDRMKDSGESAFGANGNVSNFVPIGGARPQAYTGVMHDSFGKRESFLPKAAEEYIAHLLAKHRNIIPTLQNNSHYAFAKEEAVPDDCKLLLVSYGVASRACKDAAAYLRGEKIKTTHMSLPILWPLHGDLFEKYQKISRVVVAENNTGQLLPFVAPYFPHANISLFAKWNGMPIETGELVRFCEQLFKKETNETTEELVVLDAGAEAEEIVKKSDRTLVHWCDGHETSFCLWHKDAQKIEQAEKESKIIVHKQYSFCPGCGHQRFADMLLSMLQKRGLTNENTIFVSGIGCASIVPTTFDAHLIKTSHGRALNAARAAKLAYPERTIIVISGDGDLVNIGGNHLIHTARDKNRFPIICFCLDNANYGMTGGQPSATTPQGAKTALSSVELSPSFDLKNLLYDGCGIDFFARVSVADHEYLVTAMEKAFDAASRGTFAFVQVFSHCTAYFVKNNRNFFSREDLLKLRGIWERE